MHQPLVTCIAPSYSQNSYNPIIPVEERSSEGGHTHALVLPPNQCNAIARVAIVPVYSETIPIARQGGGLKEVCKGRIVEVCNRLLMAISF